MSFKSKMGEVRRNGKYRLGLIAVLFVAAMALFYFAKSGVVKGLAVGLMALLFGAGAMELSGTDYDLGKLAETKSFSESKVTKGENGFWAIGDSCVENTMNCSNFEAQEDAQAFFETCGGVNNNIHGLDGNDKDGRACESLPSRE